MRALVWHGKEDVLVDTVPDPKLVDATDVIVKITSTAICGSDLHLYDGYQPTMESGDILGHEPMGVVVESGAPSRRSGRAIVSSSRSSSLAGPASFARRVSSPAA